MSDKLETRDGWWSAVDQNWERLYDLFFGYANIPDSPVSEIIERERRFGQFGDKRAFNAFGGLDGSTLFSEALGWLRERRDPKLYGIFHQIWESAPDNPIIHSWPGWGFFCDLLSEGQVWVYAEADD